MTEDNPEYTLDDALIVGTSNYVNTISKEHQIIIYNIAITKLKPYLKPDLIIFDNQGKEREKTEDNGRTVHITMRVLPDKVYVKLDDYGDKKTLSESVGHRVNTRYVITFVLASDY